MASPEAFSIQVQEPQKSGNAGLESAERNFVACMDSIQEYVRLQAKLQDLLKQGLLNIARAKYSMGPIGQAQYDMDMEASVRVAATADREEGTASGGVHVSDAGPSCGGSSTNSGSDPRISYSFALRKVDPPVSEGASRMEPGDARTCTGAGSAVPASAAATGGRSRPGPGPGSDGGDFGGCTDDDTDGQEEEEEEDEGLREANEFLRRMRLQMEGGDDDEAASSSQSGQGGTGGGGGGGSGGPHGVAGRGGRGKTRAGARRRAGGNDPLHWFGVLVPPALKEAQTQFTSVLETCVQLANLTQKVQACAARC